MKENQTNTTINQSYSHFLQAFEDINSRIIEFNEVARIIDNITEEKLRKINDKMAFNFSKFILFLRQYFTEIRNVFDTVTELYEEEDNLAYLFLNIITKNEVTIYHFIRRLKEQNMFDLIKVPEESPVTEEEMNVFIHSLSDKTDINILLETLYNRMESNEDKEGVYEELAIALYDNNIDFDETIISSLCIDLIMYFVKMDTHSIIRFISSLHKEGIGICEIADKDIPLPKEEELDILRSHYYISLSLKELTEKLHSCISNIVEIHTALQNFYIMNMRKIEIFSRRYMQAINILNTAFPENDEIKSITQKEKEIIYL
jgi:hypothetical protein